MTFQLTIENLTVYINTGIHNWEKGIKRRVNIDIDMSPCSAEGESFVNYTVFVKMITQFLSEREFPLIEHVAEEIVGFIAREYAFITHLQVRVNKPIVSVYKPSRSISTTLRWNRDDGLGLP